MASGGIHVTRVLDKMDLMNRRGKTCLIIQEITHMYMAHTIPFSPIMENVSDNFLSSRWHIYEGRDPLHLCRLTSGSKDLKRKHVKCKFLATGRV